MVKRRNRSRLVASVTASISTFNRNGLQEVELRQCPADGDGSKRSKNWTESWLGSANSPSMEVVGSGSEANVPGVMRRGGMESSIELSPSLSLKVPAKPPCTTRRGAQLPRALSRNSRGAGTRSFAMPRYGLRKRVTSLQVSAKASANQSGRHWRYGLRRNN